MSPMRCLAPPTIPAHKGRSGDSVLEIPVGLEDSPALPNNGGSHQLKSDKNTNKRGKTSDSSRASSKDGSPSFHRGPSKRITRGANGISKRVLPDSTNLALKRPRKRPNLRKLSYNLAGDFEDLEENGYSDQSSESPAREFSVELPVPVVDPNGRTRVAKYGILGAQQVGIWEKNRRLAKQSDVNTDPLDEDNSFSDTSLPDLDVLEDVGTFKSGNENGTEDRFSEFVGDNSYEEGLHYTSCDVPPSLESNPMQSLLLSNHDGDTVGGNPPCHNLKENPGSFRVLLEMEHSKESNMNDNEKNVPQPQPLLPSQTSFAMNLSVAMQEDGQKKDAPKRELSTNPIKLSSGDQKLDEKKDLLGSEEDIPQNNSQLVANISFVLPYICSYCSS
ncbi:hypothetical protein L873DRAFT_183603 [Choiromyces venosus 120613-1]|uniref:Uncharacterized protein n=1 Tax=Choiromyces venosus 120613-1 TaxID=1336337 RepID=A0A3N4J328_9PEZI|nr:hypothetical protein L873DRAFT_183603 [Choiromyces venosus 120613-1]